MPDTENPWIYFNEPPDDIDADGVYFELYTFAPRKPYPHLHAAPWSKRVDPPKYCDAVRWAYPIEWCVHQAITIDTWDVISSGMSAILFVEW